MKHTIKAEGCLSTLAAAIIVIIVETTPWLVLATAIYATYKLLN